MLKRVIGMLSVALSVKSITWNRKHSDRTTDKTIVFIGEFLWLSVKAVYEKGNNLRDPPRPPVSFHEREAEPASASCASSNRGSTHENLVDGRQTARNLQSLVRLAIMSAEQTKQAGPSRPAIAERTWAGGRRQTVRNLDAAKQQGK